MIAISAYIVCKNEVSTIGECIESLDSLAEIVIIDSGSTDGTLELIEDFRRRGYPIRLFHRDWQGFARQKQFALEQCRSQWCLNLDCDERLDGRLKRALSDFAFAETGVGGYAITRVDYLPGYGYPPAMVHAQKLTRLVRREAARYDLDLLVHEGLIVDGSIKSFPTGRILHFRDISISEDMKKAATYSDLKAKGSFGRGKTSNAAKIALKPAATFLKVYVLHRYAVCGTAGFIYAANAAVYVYWSEAKLYRLNRQESPETEEEARLAPLNPPGSAGIPQAQRSSSIS